MKTLLAFMLGCLLVMVGACMPVRTVGGAADTQAGGQNPLLEDRDAAVVKQFYKLLSQKDEPTKRQQDEVFNPNPGLEQRFVDAKVGKAGEPTLMQFLRKHKELFLPENVRPQDDILISSTFNFVQTVKRDVTGVPPAGFGWVMVHFPEDTKVPGKTKFRTLIFELANGKLNADTVYLDGSLNRTLRELIMNEAPTPEDAALLREDPAEMKKLRDEDSAREKIMSDHAVH